ncbi:hypothetical protein TEA_029689 [Camellia sinensis var. sinensis]|uniref:UDP-glycosyltransferases domain-containing protein n=1 Tax=Camellia sinensis var. sinensis TaxID=542762 RepID=A0A4S4E400_CAMSN|nr:hypothetical protein TEA_029689 [Camellia sinensis var. sinensis]
MFKNLGKPFPVKEIFFRGFKTLMSCNMVESSVEEVRKDKYRYLEAMKYECFLSKDEIEELAHGLEFSEGPQAKISRHGGFVSHYGWSSLVESFNFGVPIITMPMQLDQPLNARLVKEVGVGLEVMRDENERFNGKEIAQVVRKVMAEENRKGIRNKARGFTEKIRRKWEEEIDGAIKELVKL